MFFLTGSLVALYGLVYIVFGIDRTLGRINDEILMMPVMVSRVLGFSTHLDFLVVINETAVKAGVIMAAAGLLMAGFRWRKLFSRGGDTPSPDKPAHNTVPVKVRKGE
jgi:hypothetical protein